MRGQTPAGLQFLVRVIGHGDVFRGSGASNDPWLLGAISERVPKSATSILGAYLFWMDTGRFW